MNAFRLLLLSPGGELLLRGTALLLLAWVATGLLRRSHPRWRLILWRSVLVLGCLLPLGLFFPATGFQIPIDAVAPQVLVRTDRSVPAAVGNPLSAVALTGTAWSRAIPLPARSIFRWALHLFTPRSATGVFALVWIVGCAVGVVRLLRLQLRLFRLRRTAIEPNSELLALAREVRGRLGVRQPVTLRISNEVTSPFVCGLWHPTMMLPAELLQTLAPGEIPALLSHELAHLRSHDLVWCFGWRWMKTLAWFHPLVWKVPDAHNLACEQEADRLAASQWNDRSSYTRLLAQLALRVFALSSVETTLTLNGASQIAKRLNLLQHEGFRTWKRRDSMTGFGLVAGLALVAAGWGFSSANAAEAAASGQANGSGLPSPESGRVAAQIPTKVTEMKHYENSEWHFAMDIPKSWNAFPPVATNSPYEVIRFESHEDGIHLVIVFRNPIDPKKSLTEWSADVQKILARGGFGNFKTGQTTIGSRTVATLDFDKHIKSDIWSCRHYFIPDGTLGYILGFGTNRRVEMFDLYDRMAKSFQILE